MQGEHLQEAFEEPLKCQIPGCLTRGEMCPSLWPSRERKEVVTPRASFIGTQLTETFHCVGCPGFKMTHLFCSQDDNIFIRSCILGFVSFRNG